MRFEPIDRVLYIAENATAGACRVTNHFMLFFSYIINNRVYFVAYFDSNRATVKFIEINADIRNSEISLG